MFAQDKSYTKTLKALQESFLSPRGTLSISKQSARARAGVKRLVGVKALDVLFNKDGAVTTDCSAAEDVSHYGLFYRTSLSFLSSPIVSDIWHSKY